MSRRRVLFAVKAMVSAGLLSWVLYAALQREGIEALVGRVGALEPAWLVAAVCVQMGAVGAGVLRWRMLLRAQGISLPPHFIGRTYLIGRFVGAFTPSTTGLDLYRAVEVSRRTGRRGASASVILVEKGVGLLGLSLLCFALLPFGAARLLGPSALWMAAAVAGGSALGLLILRYPEGAAPLLRLAPRPVAAKLSKLLAAVGARGLSPRVLGGSVGASLLSHVLTAGVFVTTALSLGLPTPPLEVLVVGTAIVVAMLLPISIAGVGVREGVAVVLLGATGVDPADAILVGLLGYLTAQVPALLGGLLLLLPGEPAPAIALDLPEPAAGGGG